MPSVWTGRGRPHPCGLAIAEQARGSCGWPPVTQRFPTSVLQRRQRSAMTSQGSLVKPSLAGVRGFFGTPRSLTAIRPNDSRARWASRRASSFKIPSEGARGLRVQRRARRARGRSSWTCGLVPIVPGSTGAYALRWARRPEHQPQDEHAAHGQNDRERLNAAEEVPTRKGIEQCGNGTRRHDQRDQHACQNAGELRTPTRVRGRTPAGTSPRWR